MSISARDVALEALERCRKDGAWSAPVIDGLIKKYDLDRREAALAARLFLGVLQNSRFCDHYLGLYCSRGLKSLHPTVLDILRLGAYQLLFLDKIPARAAVSESVALCRRSAQSSAAGLVNAVLRRLSENRKQLPELPGRGSATYLSVRYSFPEWLTERVCIERGYDLAEAFFAACNEPAELALHVNTLKIPAAEYRRALLRAEIGYAECPVSPDCLLLQGGSVTDLPGYEEGLFYIQDPAAHCAVLAADPRPGMRVLDACAAPGGKSFAAAVAMRDQGQIVSCDLHEKKLALIRSGAARLGLSCIETGARDARRFVAEYQEAFDLVIADVPCSGLGVIRKRPEIRRKRAEEIASLPEIQIRILDNLKNYVKPGGVLMYSTCTVLRAENRDVIRTFMSRNPDFSPEDFSVGPLSSTEGAYEFWPHIDGTDGFFAAKLRRKQ
ncbi:MAG: 16S rRNA (cytosine(967)-C(5))-methyltransferase RsmB [Oscillospiraceae bacterium]|nr:16S rRNA (cytosine(967)-C(5))-methyltransferase RsmB [Oscillospiraceae bacterium]